MLAFQITALGLLTFFTVFASGSKCPKETLTRHVVCYYKGEVPLRNLTVCDCTHLIFTNAVTKNLNHSLDVSEGIKDDLTLLKERKSDLVTIFTLTLKEDQSSVVLKSKNRTQKVIDEISRVLEEIQFDGVELDFKFSKGDGVSKDSYVSFVKHLSKFITSQHRRVKREKLEDDQDDTSEFTTEEEESITETTVSSTLAENITTTTTTTTTPAVDEKEKKSDNKKNDSLKAAELKNDTQTLTNSSESNGDFKKFLLFIRLPIQLEIIGKKYDLKALTRYADILTVPTHHIFNEKDSQLTYHPSRLMGLSDIFNTDSILDFLTGMGAEKSKIVISIPASVFKFRLKDETKNAPGSPAVSGPLMLDQAELCSILKKKNWTLERDEDLTAPYAFSGKTWMAFEDEISVKIKGKYILLRELAGGAIYPIDDDINDKSCTNNTAEGGYLTSYLYNNFKNLGRKPRTLVLQNLQEEIHDTGYSSIEAGVKLSEYRIVRVVDHSGAVHVIRKNTKTQFECARQGYFSHPLGCNKFYRCVKFDQYSDEFTVFEYNCPVGLAFDERWEVCVWPGSLPNGAPCTGSSEIAPVPRSHFQCPNQEGYYADPENCRWFFVCLDHARDSITPLTAYEFRCPFGLVFNGEKLACDWPWLVGACGAGGAQGYIFGQAGGSASASNTAVFINGGNLEASLGQYDAGNQDSFFGRGFGSVLKNIDGSTYGSKIKNSYQGSQSAAKGFIASPFDDNSKRGSFASFPDYEISGGRIFNKGTGVVLEENLNSIGGVKGLHPGLKLKSDFGNDGSGVGVGSGSNAGAGYFGYSGLGRGDVVSTITTGFGGNNLGTVYVNNGHLGKKINGIITSSTSRNRKVPFSSAIAGHDITNSNSAGGAFAKGQYFGQGITTDAGSSGADFAGVGLSNVYTANTNIGLDGSTKIGGHDNRNSNSAGGAYASGQYFGQGITTNAEAPSTDFAGVGLSNVHTTGTNVGGLDGSTKIGGHGNRNSNSAGGAFAKDQYFGQGITTNAEAPSTGFAGVGLSNVYTANINLGLDGSTKIGGHGSSNSNSADGAYASGQYFGQGITTDAGKQSTEHAGIGLSNVYTSSTNLGLDGSAKIAGHDNSNLNSAGGANSAGQFFGQDITTNTGAPSTAYVGIGFSSVSTTSPNLGLNGGVQFKTVKTGQSSHAFNNVNLPLNGQTLDDQAGRFHELLPPLEDAVQPQQVLIENPVPSQQPFAVNFKSVQINEEKNIGGNGPTVATSVSSLGPTSSISQSGHVNSQSADLGHVFGNQYSTAQGFSFTPTQATNTIPVTTSHSKGSIASSGVSFGFSGTTPSYQTNKFENTNSGYSKGYSLNQGSATTSIPTISTAFYSSAERKSSTAAPIPSATPTPGAYSYQEFSSISHGDYSGSSPSVPEAGFSSFDISAGNEGLDLGQKTIFPKVSQGAGITQAIVNANSNFGEPKGVSYSQGRTSYSLSPVTQSTTTFHSSGSSFKNAGFGSFKSKGSRVESNKFGHDQQNLNGPSVASVTPIPQFGQSPSSGYSFGAKVGTTVEDKSTRFSSSTPRVELHLPAITSTSTYEGYKVSGFEGAINILPEGGPATGPGSPHGFGQNLEFSSGGDSNQQLLLHNFPAVTPKIDFTGSDKNTQSGSVHVTQSSSHFSNLPNSNNQFDYNPQVTSRPGSSFAHNIISQTHRTTTFDNSRGVAPAQDNSKFVTQVSIEPQEIVSLGTITERYDGNSLKSVTPIAATSKYPQSSFKSTPGHLNSNSLPTVAVSTPRPYQTAPRKTLQGSVLSPQQINSGLLHTNVVIQSTSPQPTTFVQQPDSVGFDQKIIQQDGSFVHQPVISHVTLSNVPIQNQQVVQAVTPSSSFVGQKDDFTTAVTPKIEIFRPKIAFERHETYQQSVDSFKDKGSFGQQSPNTAFVQNYEFATGKPLVETEYRIDQATNSGPVHVSSTLAPHGNVKIHSADSLNTFGNQGGAFPNLKTTELNLGSSFDSSGFFENSYSTTIKPVSYQQTVTEKSKFYGTKQSFYEATGVGGGIPAGHLQNTQILQGKSAYDSSVGTGREQNYSPAVGIVDGYQQSTPQTILKQQFYSGGATEKISPDFPTAQTSVNLVAEAKGTKVLSPSGAYIPPVGKLTESPIAFIEHTPNIPVQQHSPKVNLLLPDTTESPAQNYVSPGAGGVSPTQHFGNFKTQSVVNAGSYETADVKNGEGNQNVFYSSQGSGLDSFGHVDVSQKGATGQSIFTSNQAVTQAPKQYIIDGNTFSRSRSKTDSQFSSYSNADGNRGFGGKLSGETVVSYGATGEDHNDNIQELLGKYSGDFGQVRSDEQAYNGYEKGKQASSTFLYETSTDKPRQRGRGRQYYDVPSSSLPATNKYEEYEIESHRSFNAGEDYSGYSKTAVDSNNNLKKKQNNVIVISQVSDANPILIGKLAGQCSCQSNQLKVNGKSRKGSRRKNSKSQQQNEIYSHAFEAGNQGDRIAIESVTQNDLSGIGELTPETVVIGGSKTHKDYGQGLPLAGVKSVTVSPVTNDPYITSPSSVTSFPATVELSSTPNSIVTEEVKTKNRRKQFRGKARYLPPPPVSYDYDYSPVSASDIALSGYESRTQNEIDGGSSRKLAGAAYDRYGPGGWRGFDETLQGSVDCKRPGLFRHPKYCNKFYSCNYDPWKERFTLHVFNCPIRLTYDSSISACNWPVGGPACADDNLLV